MKPREIKRAVAATCAMAALALGGSYVWDENVNDGNWNDNTNWLSTFCAPPCYPSTLDDDARIEDAATITLDPDEEIDDLYLSGIECLQELTFTTPEGTTKTVSAESIANFVP